MFFKSKTRPLIGLDITTSSIKLIEISMSGGQYCVESFAVEPTPANSMTEKAIIDSVVIKDELLVFVTPKILQETSAIR